MCNFIYINKCVQIKYVVMTIGYAPAGPGVSTCGAWDMGHAPVGHGTGGMPLRGM